MAPPVFWVIGEPHEKHEIKKGFEPQKNKRCFGVLWEKSYIGPGGVCCDCGEIFSVKSERDRFLFVESEQDRSLTRTFNKCTFHPFSFHLDF